MFRTPEKCQIKAQPAGNGYSLDNSWNAELAFFWRPYQVEFHKERPTCAGSRTAHRRYWQHLLKNDYSGMLMPCREPAHVG